MEKKKTKFAPPDRSSDKEVLKSKDAILQNELFLEALNAFPEAVIVFNKNRQIVYCNEMVLDMLGQARLEDVLGKRFGEAFRCVHAADGPSGCGTAVSCRQCGSVRSVLETQMGKPNSKECRMTVHTEKGEIPLNLRVWTVPVKIGGEAYTFFTIRDIMDEKRRETLELTFFHDVLNDLEILVGYSRNVKEGILIEGENPGEKMSFYAERLMDAIYAQRDLIAAERDEYEMKKEKFFVMEFLNNLIEKQQEMRWSQSKEIVLSCDECAAEIETDRVLLTRVMTNLIKNAAEATEPGGKIIIRFHKNGNFVFSIHNDAAIKESVQVQIFQRAFSTKGKGRGIGTYSAKLFTEKYLKGKISFISKEGEGTTFTLVL